MQPLLILTSNPAGLSHGACGGLACPVVGFVTTSVYEQTELALYESGGTRFLRWLSWDQVNWEGRPKLPP